MNSTWKVGFILLLLFVVVFGFALISQYTTTSTTDDIPLEEAVINGPPLLFTTETVGYDPASEDPALRFFPGFFEPGEVPVTVSFWFRNPHMQPVRFGVLGRSCASCTSARVGYLPPGAMEEFRSTTAALGFPASSLMIPDLSTVVAVAQLNAKITWHDLDFAHPDTTIPIPAAPDASTPTWGVFQMVIKVTGKGPKTVSARIGAAVGTSPQASQVFNAIMVGIDPFEVSPKYLPLGEIPEGTAPRNLDLYYWSATRTSDTLPAPKLTQSKSDPFLTTGEPVPLTMDEMNSLAATLTAEGKAPMRVMGGYKVPVTVTRKLASPKPGTPSEPDIGPFERQLAFTGPGGTTVAVPVTARITGLVSLGEGASAVDLGSFTGKFGSEKTVNLFAQKPDLELELLPDEARPRFLKVNLSEPRQESGRRTWTLKVTVPPETCQEELPNDAVVVFQARSANGTQKVRIPVKGRGFNRGR